MEKKRKNSKRVKQQTILILIIIVFIILITAVVIKAFNNNTTKEIAVSMQENNTKSSNNEILFVQLEMNNLEQENTEQNLEEENTVSVENEEKENEPKKQNTTGTQYRLEVNCTQNVVNVYEKDENGEYTNCVKAMLCSVGVDTPKTGTFSLKKYSGWEWKGLFGDVYGQYATQITGNILFHSVPYTEKYNKGSLEYWEYDKLGTSASMGCVRLTVRNAKWIYDNCKAGTKVMFYEDSNPGPLGKPSEQKISSKSGYYNWDPTDPASENPWRNYSPEKENDKKENEIKNNEIYNNVEVNIIQNNIQTNTQENVQTNTEHNIINDIKENTVINKIEDNIINNTEV